MAIVNVPPRFGSSPTTAVASNAAVIAQLVLKVAISQKYSKL